MGLMDKFKNLFTDEEFEEEEFEEPVKIKEIKKEEPKKEKDKLPTFMREKIEKEEKNNNAKDNDDYVSDFMINKGENNNDVENILNQKQNDKKEKADVEKKETFKFPIDFEDNDFGDISRVSRHSRKNTNKDLNEYHEKNNDKLKPKKSVKVAELYKDKKEDNKENIKKFQATPIISPIYGVLNKNYHKDEIEPADGNNYEINRPSKSIDFDSVRKKAYGDTLVDDIKNNMMCENCDYYKKANSCKKKMTDDNLMYDALCEKEEINNDITLDEATENYYDYGVEYEKKNDINSYNEDDVKIVNHDEDESFHETHKEKKNGVPPVKSSINLLSTLKKSMGDDEEIGDNNKKEKNLELTDDLFNLIDSMYDERDD